MFLERPKEQKSCLKKQKITLHVPEKLWTSIQEKAKKRIFKEGSNLN